MNDWSKHQTAFCLFYAKILLLVMIMVVCVLPGRGINLSTTRFTMIAAAGLAEYDSPPQIAG
jgi:hypothetical protein